MIQKSYEVSGGVIYWSAADSNRVALEIGLAPLGLAELIPNPRTEPSALEAALKDYCDSKNAMLRKENRRKIVQPHLKRSDTGFEIVDMEMGEHENAYTFDFAVGFNEQRSLQFRGSCSYDAEVSIRDSYRQHRDMVTGAAVGTCLVKIASDKLGGTALRDSGGVYWLPEYSVERWIQVAKAVEGAAIGHAANKVYLLRTEMNEGAMKAVRDAIVSEISRDAATLSTEIYSGQLGERALETRKEQAVVLHQRISQYEAILGETLDSLRLVVKSVEESATLAALSAMSSV